MRPTAAVVWGWRHPRTTALGVLAVAGLANPLWWLLAPLVIVAGIAHLPDAFGGHHGRIRAAVIPPGQTCPACHSTHKRTVEVGIDANRDARCIELNEPAADSPQPRASTAA